MKTPDAKPKTKGWNWALGLTCSLLMVSTSWAQIGPPPVILVQPLDIRLFDGNDASFRVEAFSLTRMEYQWLYNGAKINGANKNTLEVKDVSNRDAGDYSVEISNASGTVVSLPATLVVLLDPVNTVVSLLTPRVSPEGFKINLSGPAGYECVVLASVDFVNWIPVSTNTVPDNGMFEFVDTESANRSACYYRAVVR
jgi:hypothetical protein